MSDSSQVAASPFSFRPSKLSLANRTVNEYALIPVPPQLGMQLQFLTATLAFPPTTTRGGASRPGATRCPTWHLQWLPRGLPPPHGAASPLAARIRGS